MKYRVPPYLQSTSHHETSYQKSYTKILQINYTLNSPNDIFKKSQTNLKKDRLKGFSKTSWQVFVTFQKYATKMVSCDLLRVIEITDLGPLETLKK